jgi:hypothetical protein
MAMLLLQACNFHSKPVLMKGEDARQGILQYLSSIRAKQNELSSIEKQVKSILATDKRMKSIESTAIIEGDHLCEIDIWNVNKYDGRVHIILESNDASVHYTFRGRAELSSSGVQITIEECSHGISRIDSKR